MFFQNTKKGIVKNRFTLRPLCPNSWDGRPIVFLSVNQLSAIRTPAYRCFAYGVIKK
jgi:hypothetical protein